MKRWKLVLYSVLICLPAVLLTGVGLFFGVSWVPRIIRNEPRRVTMLYREEAERLKAESRSVVPIRRRPVGPANGKIDGQPWGYSVKDGQASVWIQSLAADGRKEWMQRSADVHAEIPYDWIFYGGGGLVLLVLTGLSAFAVWSFVRFMRERDDFLAATAHDLTTPLVGMRMTIGRDDEEAKRLNERMLLIVGNIKDFLKLGGKRRRPDLKPVDLLALCKEAYRLFAADYEDAESGAAAIHGQPPSPASSFSALADETMTLQILWNLFGNDLKYAAPYGKVSVCVRRDGGRVLVEFADEGPGMTPQQMRKAFDRYYRAKTVLESGKGGFGIGLCTAREFARSMGGDLAVRANVPRGCVFALSLPAAPQRERTDGR